MNAPRTIQIRLTLGPDGNLSIEGPTQDRLLFLGVLELARDAVNHHHHESQKRVVVPPADLKVIR